MPEQRQTQAEYLKGFRTNHPELSDIDDDELMQHLYGINPALEDKIISPEEQAQQSRTMAAKTAEEQRQQGLSTFQKAKEFIQEPVSKGYWAAHPSQRAFSKAVLSTLPVGGATFGAIASGPQTFGLGSWPGAAAGATMGEGTRGILAHYLNLDNESINQQITDMMKSGALAAIPTYGAERYTSGRGLIPLDDIASILLSKSTRGMLTKLALKRILGSSSEAASSELVNPSAFGRNVFTQRGTKPPGFMYGRIPEPFPALTDEEMAAEAAKKTTQFGQKVQPKTGTTAPTESPTTPTTQAPFPEKATPAWKAQPQQPRQWQIQNQPEIQITLEPDGKGGYRIKRWDKTGGE